METVQSITQFIASLSGGTPARAAMAGVTKAIEGVTSALASESNESFASSLEAFLTTIASNDVSEEELFSALVQERIYALKGDEGLAEFTQLLDASKSAMQKKDGHIPFEDATKAALIAFGASGGISAEEATTIYSQSFDAAQLDDNTSVLFDDRGGKNDPTMAVASMEQALLLAQSRIASFDSGEETAETRDLTEASNRAPTSRPTPTTSGHNSESGSGFLFKPVSDSNGKLVVLLPPALSGQIKRVSLVNENGKVLERGQYSGNANGGRDHFRFQRAGGKYPDNLEVRVTLITGEVLRYLIDETAKRQENLSPSKSNQNTNSGNDSTKDPTRDSSGRIDNSL